MLLVYAMKRTFAPLADAEQWIPFEHWLRQFGRTRQTGHRWMQELPWLKAETINILGRLYISAAGARRFVELAAAGQLAGRHNPLPPPPRGPKKAAREIIA
jgi:hypothetical protein